MNKFNFYRLPTHIEYNNRFTKYDKKELIIMLIEFKHIIKSIFFEWKNKEYTNNNTIEIEIKYVITDK